MTLARNIWKPLRTLDTSTLYLRPISPTTSLEVVGWWEARRPAFNLMVGVVGLVSCMVIGAVILGAFFLFDVDLFPEPLSILLILVYGFMANVCYTGGWIAEIFVRRIWPQEGERLALATFKLGLQLSLILTAAPGALALVFGIVGLVGRLMGVIHKAPL
jgi:hypothetical protein